MAKVTGLVIRPLFGKYVVCDGEGTDPSRNIYDVGTQFSPEFDTWEEADEWRRKVYDVISEELQEAANEFDSQDYENASKFLDAKYSI